MAHQHDISSAPGIAAADYNARKAHAHVSLQAAHEVGALRTLKQRLHAGMTATDVRVVIDDLIGDIEARVVAAPVQQ